MVSINTNLSSLLVQNNLAQSTNGLSKAIERLTTGYKINHASDNAAGYSIAQDMTSKLSSYDVAADNISMGLDLLSVAQNTISQMQSRGERLMALWTQAQNGTFGPTSISAINQEATAIMQEINRLYINAEYNGINLFEGGIKLPDWVETVKNEAGLEEDLTPKYSGFIKEAHHMDDAEVNALTHVSELSNFTWGATYAVSTADDLERLQTLVNEGVNTRNITFIMGADIDFSEVEDYWYGIGDGSYSFKGTFDGNGHVISNFRPEQEISICDCALFAYANGSNIKNVGITDTYIDGSYGVSALISYSENDNIDNCYSTGKIYANYKTATSGGLIAYINNSTISNCYSTCDIEGGANIGGLVGICSATVENCFSTGNITSTGCNIGGLIGNFTDGTIENSFATGNVTSDGTYFLSLYGSNIGGLVGYTGGDITNCYATGNVIASRGGAGGLVGLVNCNNITNCYALGDVTNSNGSAGGITSYIDGTITNCYSAGNVTGTNYVGGICGTNEEGSAIINSYTIGNITGTNYIGGITGEARENSRYRCVCTTGSVSGEKFVGGIAGQASIDFGTLSMTDVNSFSKINGTDENSTGSLIGGIYNVESDGELILSTINMGKQDISIIGGCYNYVSTQYELIPEYDISEWLENITVLESNSSVTMQVGINGDSSSQITFETTLNYNLEIADISQASAYDTINTFLSQLSEKATEFGAVSNRLESALESTTVAMENLTSSLSTIKDADIAQVSSEYIKKQILQQASATLLATANQSPSIALQLL